MNRDLLPLSAVAVSMLAASPAVGQVNEEQSPAGTALPTKTEPTLNQFRVSARLGYNISARLENIGSAAASAYPVSVTGVTYQDGYVGRDISGNAGGLSWYWGYARDDQYVNDSILLSHSSSGTIFEDLKNDPQAGVEFSYSRQFGEYKGSKWGVEGGFSFMDLDFHASGAADPKVLTVDAFPLGGVVPPLAPYTGSFEGPGALIGETPTRYPVNVVSRFDISVYGLRLGPYVETPLSERVSFTLTGGVSLLLAASEYRIEQTANVPGGVIHSGRNVDTDLGVLPGGYIGGRLTVGLNDKVKVFTGLQLESNWRHTHRVGDKRAEVDFWNAIYWSFGGSYSF